MATVRQRDAFAAIDFEVTIKDYAKLKREMKAFDPELRRAMDKEIRETLKPIATDAKGRVPVSPMTNWRKAKKPRGEWGDRLAWDQSTVKKGIRVRQGGKRKKGSATFAAWRITNDSAAGAVFEVAGKKDAGGTLSRRAFIANLSLAGGQPSRLIWSSWDKVNGEKAVTENVRDIVRKYEAMFQAKID